MPSTGPIASGLLANRKRNGCWGGSDPSFRSPMAVAVIGGLITYTFLSLLVIPAVFTYVDDFAEWVKRRWHRGAHGAPASMPQQS